MKFDQVKSLRESAMKYGGQLRMRLIHGGEWVLFVDGKQSPIDELEAYWWLFDGCKNENDKQAC